MSPLQLRMLEDMQLHGLSARTREAYARAVWQLAQHYRRPPDQLSNEELRQYFLYLTNEKKIAWPTATIALCGIKFFYEQTLKHEWPLGPRIQFNPGFCRGSKTRATTILNSLC